MIVQPAVMNGFSDHIEYYVLFNEKLDIVRRYPDRLFTTLAKVGGLLGLLRLITFFLVVYHQRLFESQYQPKQP